MTKIVTQKPLLVLLYGFPGSGRTYFAKHLSESLGLAHVEADRIRSELFEKPRYDKRENEVINHLVDYMGEEFLKAGVSVVYDGDTTRLNRRRHLRDMARKVKSNPIIIWLQIDPDSAFNRASSRDKRKADDRYAKSYDKDAFDQAVSAIQNPTNEDYIVISGKHTFNSQRGAVMKKLFEFGLIDSQTAVEKVVKPELVNLIPNLRGGRVDNARRNIFIR